MRTQKKTGRRARGLAFKTLLTPCSWPKTRPGGYPWEAIRHSSAIADPDQKSKFLMPNILPILYKPPSHHKLTHLEISAIYDFQKSLCLFLGGDPRNKQKDYLQIEGRVYLIQSFWSLKSLFEGEASPAATGPSGASRLESPTRRGTCLRLRLLDSSGRQTSEDWTAAPLQLLTAHPTWGITMTQAGLDLTPSWSVTPSSISATWLFGSNIELRAKLIFYIKKINYNVQLLHPISILSY